MNILYLPWHFLQCRDNFTSTSSYPASYTASVLSQDKFLQWLVLIRSFLEILLYICWCSSPSSPLSYAAMPPLFPLRVFLRLPELLVDFLPLLVGCLFSRVPIFLSFFFPLIISSPPWAQEDQFASLCVKVLNFLQQKTPFSTNFWFWQNFNL